MRRGCLAFPCARLCPDPGLSTPASSRLASCSGRRRRSIAADDDGIHLIPAVVKSAECVVRGIAALHLGRVYPSNTARCPQSRPIARAERKRSPAPGYQPIAQPATRGRVVEHRGVSLSNRQPSRRERGSRRQAATRGRNGRAAQSRTTGQHNTKQDARNCGKRAPLLTRTTVARHRIPLPRPSHGVKNPPPCQQIRRSRLAPAPIGGARCAAMIRSLIAAICRAAVPSPNGRGQFRSAASASCAAARIRCGSQPAS